jgi:hypothetical protein
MKINSPIQEAVDFYPEMQIIRQGLPNSFNMVMVKKI